MKKYIEIYQSDIKEIRENSSKITHNNADYIPESDFINIYVNAFDTKKAEVQSAAARLIMQKVRYSDAYRDERVKQGLIADFLYKTIAPRKILVILEKGLKVLEVK